MTVDTTKDETSEIYKGIYNLSYNLNCTLGSELCLCPALSDYKFSFHLCRHVTHENNVGEGIHYSEKDKKVNVNIDISENQYCNSYKHDTQRINLHKQDHDGKLDDICTFKDLEINKKKFLIDIISWELTQTMYSKEKSIDFWTLYCAINPNCFMYDICNFLLKVFECIQEEKQYIEWLQLLCCRLEKIEEIYIDRVAYMNQYKIFMKSIYAKLESEKCYVSVYKDRTINSLKRKQECSELCEFVSLSEKGNCVYQKPIKAIFSAVLEYLEHWNDYGFTEHREDVGKCRNLLQKYLKEDETSHKFEDISEATAKVHAGIIANVIQKIYFSNQLDKYWEPS